MGMPVRLLLVALLCAAADGALVLSEGPLKDSASALDSARAEQARQEQHVVVPADAVELPAVKTLEILRGTPIHDLEACAVKGFCSNTLAGRLADFSAHRGAVELVDAMAANFCLKSPFSSQLAFCRTHHFEGMRPDTQDHHDAESRISMLCTACSTCPSAIRQSEHTLMPFSMIRRPSAHWLLLYVLSVARSSGRMRRIFSAARWRGSKPNKSK